MTTTVLIADDHPMIRSAVTMLLDGTNFDVVASADNADSALVCIARDNPDIVVLDLAMPGGSGLDVLRKLRAQGDGRRVVVLTAAIDDHKLAVWRCHDSIHQMTPDGIVVGHDMRPSSPAACAGPVV